MKKMMRITAIASCLGLLLQTVACGTVLHPERKGQTGGRLDPAIVALNAVGLVLFFVPGLVAFAIDFYNGTIYLPGGGVVQLDDAQLERVTQNGQVDHQALEAMLKQDFGISVDLEAPNLQVQRLDSGAEAVSVLAGYSLETRPAG